jgi:DNA-binding NtrC family response regulator
MIKTIVMVEDDDDDRRIFHNLLVPHGDMIFNVYTCPLLSTCLQVMFEKRPDLVVLDLNLPDSRGTETLKKFLQTFPNQKVLVVTGDMDADYKRQLVELGAIDAFEKGTVTVGDFRTAILQALEDKPSQIKVANRA